MSLSVLLVMSFLTFRRGLICTRPVAVFAKKANTEFTKPSPKHAVHEPPLDPIAAISDSGADLYRRVVAARNGELALVGIVKSLVHMHGINQQHSGGVNRPEAQRKPSSWPGILRFGFATAEFPDELTKAITSGMDIPDIDLGDSPAQVFDDRAMLLVH